MSLCSLLAHLVHPRGCVYPKAIYAEGYGVTAAEPSLLVLHGWCGDEAGRLIDPTWEEPEACSSFGIAFRPDVVARGARKNRHFIGVWMPDFYVDPRRFEGVQFRHEFSPSGGDPSQAALTATNAGSSKGR